MNGYFAILKMRMKTLFQYRAAAFAGIFTQLFWGIIQVMIFQAFYSHVTEGEPISLSQAITFIWLVQALFQLIPWCIDKEVEAQVRSGSIAYELVRPLHLYSLLFVKSLALRAAPTLLRCFPVFAIGGLFLGLASPVSWTAGILFSLSIFFAFFLSSAITTLVMISLFWTFSGDGIQRFLPPCIALLSGMIVPLPLFPDWVQPFISIQPFRGVVDIPCRLYTGIIPASEAFYYLGFQVAWTAAFIVAGQLLMNRALKKFVIQGG